MLKRAAILSLLACSSPALAQQAPQPSETTEKFGAWTVRCVSQGDAAEKTCEVFIAIQGQAGTIAQVALGRPQAAKETLMVARTPLGVLVSQPVTVTPQAAGAMAVELPFVTCLAAGCIAQATAAGDWLGKLAADDAAAIGFAERTGRKIQIQIPTAGLKDALGRIGVDCASGACVIAE